MILFSGPVSVSVSISVSVYVSVSPLLSSLRLTIKCFPASFVQSSMGTSVSDNRKYHGGYIRGQVM